MIFMKIGLREQVRTMMHDEQEFAEAINFPAFGGENACVKSFVQINDNLSSVVLNDAESSLQFVLVLDADVPV
jgi:hypothetical protein